MKLGKIAPGSVFWAETQTGMKRRRLIVLQYREGDGGGNTCASLILVERDSGYSPYLPFGDAEPRLLQLATRRKTRDPAVRQVAAIVNEGDA